MCAMNLALVANNIGLMWVGVEVATLSTVMMVGIYRTPEAIEAAWKYFILGSVGIGLAFFGTILIYLVGQDAVGDGLSAMSWDLLVKNAAKLDPKMLSLAFVFLLVGYGTKVGLAPFHAWLPDAHAEGPTPISAVLSGLLLNVALYALLRFKMVLAGNAGAINVGAIMVVIGLVSLVFAAFMLYRRRDIKRLFAYSSIEHMGIAAFAFGMGGPLANFAGLLHMTMHSLIKSGIFFAVGHIAQVKGTQRIAAISGMSVSHPVLALLFSLGVIAIAGLPPFGMFTSEFMLVTSTFARQPALSVVLIFGLLVAFGALVLRLQDIVFGEPSGKIPRGESVLHSGVHAPDARARCRPVVAGRAGAMVPQRCGPARMTTMSAIATTLAKFAPVSGHAPWPRFEVDATTWKQSASHLVAARAISSAYGAIPARCTWRSARPRPRPAWCRLPLRTAAFRRSAGFICLRSVSNAPCAISTAMCPPTRPTRAPGSITASGVCVRRSGRAARRHRAIPWITNSCRCTATASIRFPSVRCMPASSSRGISGSPPMARPWRGSRSGSAMCTRASTAS